MQSIQTFFWVALPFLFLLCLSVQSAEFPPDGKANPTPAKPKPGADLPLLVVINGESNSGGYAPNSEAPLAERGLRPSVKILNNATLASFDDLNIGGNNLVGHARLANGATHGFELELANRAETNAFYHQPCYLVKTGQGGSVIANWTTNNPCNYFKMFKERVESARKLLGNQPHRTVILFSLGINDAIHGTNLKVWKAGVKEHFENLRKELGANTPIVMTRFMPRYAAVNAVIEEICREVPNTYSVNTLDAPLRDDNHWNYRGMKLVAGRMLDVVEGLPE
jgi:hypothetical protein